MLVKRNLHLLLTAQAMWHWLSWLKFCVWQIISYSYSFIPWIQATIQHCIFWFSPASLPHQNICLHGIYQCFPSCHMSKECDCLLLMLVTFSTWINILTASYIQGSLLLEVFLAGHNIHQLQQYLWLCHRFLGFLFQSQRQYENKTYTRYISLLSYK